MKKAFLIAWKDILTTLYDKSGFAFLILTPLALTLVFGLTFGGGDDTPNFRIPLAVVNHDSPVSAAQFQADTNGSAPAGRLALGNIVTDILTSPDLSDLLDTTVLTDEAAAKAAVDAGKSYAAVVILPENLSQAAISGEKAAIVIYSDPARDLSAKIVAGIVRQIARRLASGRVMFSVTLQQLIDSGRITPDGIPAIAQKLGAQLQTSAQPAADIITLNTVDAAGKTVKFDPLAFFAPSMAIIFLAFGASRGARSILAEAQNGTFARLNATPTAGATILFGKLLGILFNGGIQFGTLLIAGALLFGLRWGDPSAVAVLAIAVIFAFSGLGLLMAVIAKDEKQANTISTAVILVMMVVGGNLTPASDFPAWLQTIAKITPNYWSVEGFIKLGQAQPLANILPELLALGFFSVMLFGAGLLLYRRRALV